MTADPRWMRDVRDGDGRQHHLGRRDREVRPVMLADAEAGDADLVGQDRFLHDMAQDLCVGERLAVARRA